MSRQRGNGEGNIRRRTDGRWEGRVSLPNGKRKSYFGRTREEVAAKLVEGLKAAKDNLPVPSERITVGAFLAEWLAGVRSTVRPHTAVRYEQSIRLHVLPRIGRLPLARLEPKHLQALYAACLADGLAPATVRMVHAVVGRALGDAVRWGNVTRNVALLVTPPRVKHAEIRPLTAEQAQQLLEAARGTRWEAFYVLAVTTGMREGELLGLCWSDVNLDSGELSVRHTLRRMPGVGLQLLEPKTDHSRRRVRLSATAVLALRKHRAGQAAERLRRGPAWEDQGLVFPAESGRPMDAGNLTRWSFWPLLTKAGLPRIRVHDLRHTAATLLLSKGVNPKVVSELLGHSKVGITLDVYSHVVPDMQERAAEAMDAILGR